MKIAPRHELLLLKKPQKPQNFKLRAPEYGWEIFFATQNTEKCSFYCKIVATLTGFVVFVDSGEKQSAVRAASL